MDKTIEQLTKMVETEPQNPELLKELGNLYFREGKYDKAIETYKASLEIDPGYYKALYNLGNTITK